MNTKRIKCILTGGCKFKSSDTESKCNDKEKTCTITETCYKCGKKYTAVFTYKQLGIPDRGECMKEGVVNYPIKIIYREIINAMADIEVHHEEDRRIIWVECVINYTDLPEECILEIGYLKRKFKLMHTESVASESGIYKLKFMFERVEDINIKDEWWDSLRSIVR